MRGKLFRFLEEDTPGDKWLSLFDGMAAGYRQWFLKEGEFNRPTFLECQRMLTRYMPELVPMWEHLVALAGGDDHIARLLSLYCPTPYVSGCSQGVWVRYAPILVRNYDYDSKLCEGVILKSCWNKTSVIASTDCLWGVLDGMNKHGLIVSLSFGGKNEVGKGFGIPLILRYILEFCKTTKEAVDVLCRIPTHMAYNVTILDTTGCVNTVEVSPSSRPEVTSRPFAVNHQGDFSLTKYAIFSKSYERKQAILDKLFDPSVSLESFVNAFEYAPLWATNHEDSFGTLYTAVYNPSLKATEFRWPHHTRIYQSFQHFEERELWVGY